MNQTFRIEEITNLGQQHEPQLRAFLRRHNDLWMQAQASAFEPTEDVGIYLGNNQVLVVLAEAR